MTTAAQTARRMGAAHLLLGLLLAPALLVSREARADDRKACDAAYDQAQTYRDGKKLVLAREQLRICARSTCPSSMVRDCTGWLADTEHSIPSVIAVATDASGGFVGGVKVTLDAETTPRTVDGTSWDVDPGTHKFTFVLPDGTKVDKTVLVIESQKNQRVAVTLGASAPPTPAPASSAPVAGAPATTPEPGHGSSGSPLKTVGFVVAGVGAAGLVVGAVFGSMALATKGSNCPTESTCAPGTASQALGQGTVSTVGFVAGGVLAAGGVALVLLAPKHADATGATLQAAPAVGSSQAGVILRGSW
ncbi:MAG: hypothetical protein ACRENE_31845 [Polyangiaceae bacterium]